MTIEPQLISARGSERATNDSGKIVTFQDRTHLVWQDVTRQGYPNQVRSFDHGSGRWSEPVTLDLGIDNHARGVMTVDQDGFLHVVLGGHGSSVTWCRSQRPNDTSAWTEPQPIGVGTYPIFLCAPDGSLLLAVRGQGAERRDRGVDLYRRPPGGDWEPPLRVVQLAAEYGQAYAAFHMQMGVAPDGVLHAVIDFYEGEDEQGRGLHQAVCYARSGDGGQTWSKADGSPVALPARPEDLDMLARNTMPRHEKLPPPDLRNGGLVVDSRGRAFMLYLNHTEAPGLVIMARTDADGRLRTRPVSPNWEREWPEMRAVETRLSIRADDSLCALVQLTPFNDEWSQGRPTRAMHMRERADQRFVWLLSRDGGESFEVSTFLEPGMVCNCPSLEQAVGANSIPADRLPGVIYFDGSREYPGGGDYYAGDQTVAAVLAGGGFRTNNVWFADGGPRAGG